MCQKPERGPNGILFCRAGRVYPIDTLFTTGPGFPCRTIRLDTADRLRFAVAAVALHRNGDGGIAIFAFAAGLDLRHNAHLPPPEHRNIVNTRPSHRGFPGHSCGAKWGRTAAPPCQRHRNPRPGAGAAPAPERPCAGRSPPAGPGSSPFPCPQ